MERALETRGVEAAYFDTLSNGSFVVQRCDDCGTHLFYPRQLCTHCGGVRLTLVEPSGLGVVYSTTVVRRKPELGGDVNVAVIELDEGPRMMSRVEGLPPEEVRIGMRVRARVGRENDRPLVLFDPAPEDG
jgi:uncharacterized OB-fold protein